MADNTAQAQQATPAANTPATTPATAGQQEQGAATNYDSFFEKLDSILDKRSEGLAKSALKDNGVEAGEIGEIVSAWKESRAQKAQESTLAVTQFQQENASLKAQIAKMQIESIARDQANELGIDASALPYVTKLADLTNAINEKGEPDKEKIAAALSKVLDDVPAFKKNATEQKGFVKVGGTGGNDETTNEADKRLRAAFGLK